MSHLSHPFPALGFAEPWVRVSSVHGSTDMIPFIDLQAQRARIADKVDAAIAGVLKLGLS